MQEIMGIVTFIFGVAGAVFGGVSWYKGSVEKRYAAEREIGHLKRSVEQVNANLDLYRRDLESHLEAIEHRTHTQALILTEIKSLLIAKLGDHSIGQAR